ncbi:SDR family oxidoreductase [Gammaproteobacteria bacterium]|nr:SDR family oxidoreductase [Gammaproteobacteria bacterium]
MNKILVTGGAGFLGSHLCDELLKEENNRVICLDNLYTGSERNINHLKNNSKFEFINHDVTSPLDIAADQIYNLACPASPIHYQHDPVKTMKTSVLGSINVLNLAKKNNSRVLQASTSEIYGDPIEHPQTESYWGNVNPIGIRSCYDEGKRCAETLCVDYDRQYGVDTRIVRIFNTYGPRMNKNDGRVVSNFIVQAIMGKDLTIFGDGSQTRSFCYYTDLIDGFIKMMNTSKPSTPINLGNPREFTILELANLVIKKVNSNSKICFSDLPSDDPKQRRPNIALANSLLSWAPAIEIEEGLDSTINYFKKIL